MRVGIRWLRRAGISLGVGVALCMLAFMLRFTPLYPVSERLVWFAYAANSIFPINDTPSIVDERLLDIGIPFIVPVYSAIILLGFFLKDMFFSKKSRKSAAQV